MVPRTRLLVSLVAAALAVTGACAAVAQAAGPYNQLSRGDFNRVAVRQNLPLFWIADSNGNGAIDPDELATLLFYPAAPAYTDASGFTPAFDAAYQQLVAARAAKLSGTRLTLVAEELDAGTPTLVRSDLSGLSEYDRQFAAHMVTVATLIDQLYARTVGATALASRVPADPLDQSLFRRDWGPDCQSPGVGADPACSAIPGAPQQFVDYYPAYLQKKAGFCSSLERRHDASKLLGPFTVVRSTPSGLKAVPYTTAYRAQMTAISDALRAAAAYVTDPAEAPLLAYLRAAADAFVTNNWSRADEAWARMNAQNSKWYVRVGPDEVYADPCGYKAGFHLTFARIDTRSLDLQNRLAPLRGDMEAAIAQRAGAPYKKRAVRFQLPDFIDILLNAGDDRSGFGITIGQSLPNWGKVAAEGRGRTVAMANLYTDPDSIAAQHGQAASLLDQGSMQDYSDDPNLPLIATVLHEATHNLGPTSSYRVHGKRDTQIFGGDLASVLEELKAETGGMFLLDLVRRDGVVDAATARKVYMDQLVYCFGEIADGMYNGDGSRNPYGQLCAIEVGYLMTHDALIWSRTATAADGTDRGSFAVDVDRLPAAFAGLIRVVTQIKARGDNAGARALAKRYVSGSTVPRSVIAQRIHRFPDQSFVYSLGL